MGGKHKQAQRTKNNARPSSSGRSAELLGTSINPFVGFSTVKDVSVLPVLPFSSLSNDESELNLDTSFQLVLKKMNKKDATTKLKALQEFTELVRESQPEAVKAVLAFWPRLYAALAVDTEHRVREATHCAHRAVVLKVRRDLAPYLKQLAGPWFTSQYDTYAPAASAATQAFQDAFPSKKLQEAIVFCQEEIISYICDNITVQTPQTLTNPKGGTPENAEAKYERLLIASLQGYTLYLNRLSADQLQAAESLNERIISNPKFWKLSKIKAPLIRAAWFTCIAAIFQNAPFLLKDQTQHVTSAVFCNLDESEPSVINATWEAALFILSNIEEWWKFVSVEKLVLPKLWKVLKEGGQGSAVIIYPNLLPLISHFPPNVDATALYGNFFENMRIGMRKRTVVQSRLEFGAISSSFIECIRYISHVSTENTELCQSLIAHHLIPALKWTFTDENITTKTLYSEISSLLQFWAKNRNSSSDSENYSGLIDTFWSEVERAIKENLTGEQNYPRDKLLQIFNKHTELLLCLKKPAGCRQRKQKVQFVTPEQSFNPAETSQEVTHASNPYMEELNELVYKICYFYLKFIRDNRRNELISSLCLLIQHFQNEALFAYLNRSLLPNQTDDKSVKLITLHNNVFLNFLQVESSCFEAVVDVIFQLFEYLNTEEKTQLLDSLEKLRTKDSFSWCVAKALSYPYCNDVIVQKWLSTAPVSKLLIQIASDMLKDEISPEKSLLLKQAFSQNSKGDLYISKEACEEILSLLCNCLLSPSSFPFTIDICASFAAQLSATLYTEQTLFTYGDKLLLSLFSLSCSTNYDPETITRDTLWEISTAWQDILATVISTKCSDFQNLLKKFTQVIQEEFLSESKREHFAGSETVKTGNEIVIDRLTNVTVDLIKCALQSQGANKENPETKKVQEITDAILLLPAKLQPTHQLLTDLCAASRMITGQLNWPKSPLRENVLEDNFKGTEILIKKYFLWHRFVVKVICDLFKKTCENLEAGESESTLEEGTESINALVATALDAYATACIFTLHYKTTKLYSEVTEVYQKMKEELSEFLLNVIPPEMLEDIIASVELICSDTVYVLHSDLLGKTNQKDVYNKLVKFHRENEDAKLNRMQLIQVFSQHLGFGNVPETKKIVEMFIVNRSLIQCKNNEVQIAEALSIALSIRAKNVEALFYNRDISEANWEEIQLVIELIRLLTALIDHKPSTLSSSHWDFILISLTSWTSSVEKSRTNYNRKFHVLQFICAVCDFYVAFHKCLNNKDEETNQQNRPNISTEYADLFAQDVNISLINTWIHIAESELDSKSTPLALVPALETIGSIVPQLEEHYLIQVGDSRLPKWQKVVQICGGLLRAQLSVFQLWGYCGLRKAVGPLVALDDRSVGNHEPRAYGLMCSQLGHVLSTVQDVVLIMLMDFKLGEDSCRVEPFTDSYTFTLGYLLLWDILLSFCQNASTELRYQYSDWLRSGEYLKNLLNNIFRLMPTEVLHCSEGKKSGLTYLFTVEPSFQLSDAPTSERLEHMVCWVYRRALMHLPGLVRQWWSEAEPRVAHTADQVTATHVSPELCAHELRDVTERRRTTTDDDNMRVAVHAHAREVVATYTVDEARMELVITLAPNHPLGPVHVDCSKQIGGTAQWRSWVMQLTVFLTHQNGRIWDGLSLWKSNLDKKFDGVEECYICFSVLHNATYQLPKLSCQTCKKKFHSSCLYKWFSTSNKSTCPICRNLF